MNSPINARSRPPIVRPFSVSSPLRPGRRVLLPPNRPTTTSAGSACVSLSMLALVVGVVTGFGAVVFRDLIGLIHNVLFLGQFAVRYDANLFTPPSPWGAFIILVPVIGALVVTFLVSTFAPEARGHGVPEVMDAIYYKGGVIRPVVAVVKSLASAIAIGSGAAVGREGPIIQIGSALGSTLGQIVAHAAGAAHHPGRRRRRRRHRRDLQHADRRRHVRHRADDARGQRPHLPAGGARRPAPRPSSAGSSSARSRPSRCRNWRRSASMPARRSCLCLYALLGVVIGVAAAGFVRGLHLVEDLFDKIKERYTRHVLGMLLVGMLIYALQQRFGHYYVEGVGYATVQAILLGQLSAAGLLAAAVRLQAAGDLAQPRVGLVGRDLLAVAVHGRDDRRRLRRGARRAASAARRSTSRPSPWSAWGRWSAAAPAR